MTDTKTRFELAKDKAVGSPIRRKVLIIVSIFIMSSIMLISLGYAQSETLNGVRAFVRGEGLWAKAQKDAVLHLERYARSRNLSDYEKFKQALSINLGDKDGRLALLETPPNKERSRIGFLAGGNHPNDVDSMIDFFIRFEDFYYLKQANAIWDDGDRKINELILSGQNIHQCIIASDNACLKKNLEEIKVLSLELHKIGTDFSLILSEGAHWIKSTLFTISLVFIGLLSFSIFLITRHIVLALNKTEQELMDSENRFLSLYQANVIGIMDWHMDGRIYTANDAYLNIIGYSREELEAGKINWRTLTPDEYKSTDQKATAELLKNGMCTPFEKEIIHKQGHFIPVYLGATLLNGETDKGICFVVDQSLQKSNETKLKLSATVFETSNDGMIITDKFKHIIAVNNAYCKKTGLSKQQLLGTIPPILALNSMTEGFHQNISRSLHDTGHWQGDVLDTISNEQTISAYVKINIVKDKHNKISHFVISITDISERKAAEEQLKKLAHYDYLTGLANRSLYHDRLTQALIRAKRHNTLCALLFFDLDKFKPINDLYGHETGDSVLKIVASRLKKLVRDSDTVARLGGDEFIIIMEDLQHSQHAGDFSKKIIHALAQPYQVNEHILEISCSVGISLYPQDGEDTLTLTRNADIAMYAAKASGRNQYYFYNPSLNQ
jgi:diguanylate cyclase (GGDEF)-like protein/PAS domain S-box-containing protein